MKALVLLILPLLSTAMIPQLYANDGEEYTFQLTAKDVKSLTRNVDAGRQTWQFDGPNKDSWVDENGKPIDSSNYKFVAPGTIIFSNVTTEDSGYYSYEPKNPPSDDGPQVIDRTFGIRLEVVKLVQQE